MTRPIRALSESWPSTTDSESPSINEVGVGVPGVSEATSAVWTWRLIEPDALEAEFEDIDDVVAASEKDPGRRSHLERARRAIADRLPVETLGLASLRLKLGWSQKRLAEEIETSQPHVARIEMGREDIRISTVRRLARALGVSIAEIDSALLARRPE
jgi:DNA-binding XRE family transcriptional regulator